MEKQARYLNRHPTKGDTPWQIQVASEHMKRYSTSYIIGELQINQRDTTIHLLESQNSKTLTTSNASEDWSNRKSYPLMVEMQNDIHTLEESLLFSFKIKHMLII